MNLLIVEDDEKKREQLVTFLKARWPEAILTERRSYRSGLKEIIDGCYDLVLLDMSMPTYDKTPSEPGGRPKPFAGREILSQMERRAISTPVIVFTMFESFGEEGSKLSLSELKLLLERNHRYNYIGTVYYNVAINDWEMELDELMTRLTK
jgi:CheY-like chemotaxis protein